MDSVIKLVIVFLVLAVFVVSHAAPARGPVDEKEAPEIEIKP